ncbi:hypothetical protein HDV00_005485 [Rhizophlyctis rosea]|nr:hypothetical protein HDV00_005485 [Rhizophlyctis rosea]
MPTSQTIALTVQNVAYCNTTATLMYEIEIWAYQAHDDVKQYTGTCRTTSASVSCQNPDNTTYLFDLDSAPVFMQVIVKEDHSTWYAVYSGTMKCDKELSTFVPFDAVAPLGKVMTAL